jgi:hypothetical protein
MADISKWLSENWWLIFLIVGYIGLRQEFNRIDKRIDAVIALLKRRGIDIYEIPENYDVQ